MALDLQQLVARLVRAEYEDQPLDDLIAQARVIEQELDTYIAAAVLDARNAGGTWERVAEAANTSVATARSRWQKESVNRRLRRRSGQRGTTPSPGMTAPRPVTGPSGQRAQRAAEQLAAALTSLQERSGLANVDVAKSTSLSPSYISRILSGNRLPGWDVICTLSHAFGGEPAHLRLLWETAHGIAPTPGPPVPHATSPLLSALQGLYLADGRPDHAEIRRRSGGALPLDLIRGALAGEQVPEWPDLGRLITALDGSPEDFQPLWEMTRLAFDVRKRGKGRASENLDS
ncbi:helix-turn-helix transcriptional regulator [Streptomyces carpaticus]|uniref:helix-turn-helix domain-containing protein n=1 Tax=Streptomyces carpaticus TaxID=285558 RepID=UPI0031F89761